MIKVKDLFTVCYGCTESNWDTALEFIFFAHVLPALQPPAISLSTSLSLGTHLRLDTCWHVQVDSVLDFYIQMDLQSMYVPCTDVGV